MITFWGIAVAMMLAAAVLALYPLFTHSKPSGQRLKQLNISIFKQRMRELEEENEQGLIEQDQFQSARAELERSLLIDVDDDSVHAVQIRQQSSASRNATILAILILIPAMAIPLYLNYGSPEQIEAAPVQQQATMGTDSMQEAVAMLVRKLEQEPGNIEGWVLLAKSYLVLGRIDDAVQAYEQAYKLEPQNPDIMVDYAEMLARANNGDISGKPLSLIRMALAVAPEHSKGLWIMGIVAFNDGDFASAILHWERLQSTLESGSEDYLYLQQKIDEARTRLAGEVPAPATAGQQGQPAAEPQDAAATTGVTVSVTLDAAIAARAQADDAVFIFAQAVNGPRMPLAALRVQVRDLPLTAVLDDSSAMGPMARISSVEQVTISARVSRSGNPTASSGDLQGSAGPVRVGAPEPVVINIDQVLP